MDKPHLLDGGVAREYSHITSSDSDDSRSSISRSEDAPPCITYTSDDSTDVVQSDDATCCIDDAGHYIHRLDPNLDDGASRCLLLGSGSPSPQPTPQPDPLFPSVHPLAAITFSTGSDPELGVGEKEAVVGMIPQNGSLRVCTDCNYGRSSSVSSESSESSPGTNQLMPDYHQLNSYPDVEYEPLNTTPVPGKKLQDPLDMFVDMLDIPNKIQPLLGRYLVGDDVHISARYQDAPYVSWNWGRIRHSCVMLNLSLLIALLCVGVGLLVQMPRGKECNPARLWWQGSVMYEVFVPSFQDSDADGVGDLSGLVDRLDYLQNLGIKAIRVNSILETPDLLQSASPVLNYSSVDGLVGTNKDLHLLAALLHERRMYLMMDIPLVFPDEGEDSLSSSKVQQVSEGLRYWLSRGVDGFFFPDIVQCADEPGLMEALHAFRNILDRFTIGSEHRVLMVPVALLNTLAASAFADLHRLLHLVDLIDAPINLAGTAETIPDFLNATTAWDNHASLPWINWNMGGAGRSRVYDMTLTQPLGRSLLLLFLPGTVTLYYGDEIALSGSGLDKEWSSIMRWSEGVHAGFSAHPPWQRVGDGGDVAVMNDTIAALATMVAARQDKVPMYINGIFDYVGDYHPKKSSNLRVRYVDQDLLVLDRFFPRRNQYAVVTNLGPTTLTKDLSHLYFGGSVLASSHGQEGYIQFRKIVLQPGESLVCVLDL